MKKKNFAAAFIIAALIGTVSLSACNGGCAANRKGTFNLSDYCVPIGSPAASGADFSALDYVHGGYSEVKKTSYSVIQTLNSYALAKVTKSGDGGDTYALYDVESGTELFSELTGLNLLTAGTVNYFEMISPSESKTIYRYAGPDGNLLVDMAFENSSSFQFASEGTGYIGDVHAEIFKATYLIDESKPEEKKEIYYAQYTDENGDKVWESLSEGEISASAPGGGYTAGDYLELPKNEIYPSAGYPRCYRKGYEYTLESDGERKIFTFYNEDGERTGRTVLYENGSPIAFAGDYFFYYDLTPVREDSTKHYNCEFVGEYGAYKLNYVLYRYNFVNGGNPEEIATDYVILNFSGSSESIPLYNYETDKFDKFYATSYKMIDKIAVIGVGSRTYKIVFGEDMSICADLSDTGIDLTNPVYKLNDDRYLCGNRIFDGNYSTVAVLPSGGAQIWREEELIVCGDRMFVNYDGKVIIPSVPVGFEVYGGSVYANKVVYSRENPSGLALSGIVTAGDGETVDFSLGVIYKKIPDGDLYSYEIYDLQGKKLGDIGKISEQTLNLQKIGGKLVFHGTESVDGVTRGAVWIIG